MLLGQNAKRWGEEGVEASDELGFGASEQRDGGSSARIKEKVGGAHLGGECGGMFTRDSSGGTTS